MFFTRNHALHEQAVISVLKNISLVVLEMTRATLVVHASVRIHAQQN